VLSHCTVASTLPARRVIADVVVGGADQFRGPPTTTARPPSQRASPPPRTQAELQLVACDIGDDCFGDTDVQQTAAARHSLPNHHIAQTEAGLLAPVSTVHAP